jgi:hypothetical protein
MIKYDRKPIEFWKRLRQSDECSIERKLLNKLAEGIQKRVDAIKATNGWYTKY